MSKLSLAYNIVNLTPADANPVEANYNNLEQFINQEIIERDGSVAMRAELLLANDPLTPLGAATKQYVDQVLPIGMITPFGGVGSPPGGKWLECNGAELESATYPQLYAVIGTRYVTGTPAGGRFNLPNLVGRFPMGGGGTDAVGSAGGSRDAVVVAHNHPIDHIHNQGTTQAQNANHDHEGVDHFHGLDANGGTSAGGSHGHGIAHGAAMVAVFGSGIQVGTGASAWQTYQHLDDGFHAHSLGGRTAAADRSLRTGGNNQSHGHVFQPPAFAGNSGAASGATSSPTDKNLPPYLAVTWIIRAA
jgi:microcystin-dependent protein